MVLKEQVLNDIIIENKKNIIKLMKLYNSTYTEAIILWLKLNKKYVDNMIIIRSDDDGVKLL